MSRNKCGSHWILQAFQSCLDALLPAFQHFTVAGERIQILMSRTSFTLRSRVVKLAPSSVLPAVRRSRNAAARGCDVDDYRDQPAANYY